MRVLVLLAGGYGVIHGRITLGVLTAFMEYTSKITWPIENVGWLGNCFASAIASFNKKLNKISQRSRRSQNRKIRWSFQNFRVTWNSITSISPCMTHRFCGISTLP